MSGRNPIMYPIHTMAGAEWNILDDSGCRIAWCGYDNDHEKSGPPIAAELVRAVNDCQHYKNRERQLTEDCNSKYEQIRDLESRLTPLERLRDAVEAYREERRKCDVCNTPAEGHMFAALAACQSKPGERKLAKCGHVAYRNHDDLCIQDGCPHAAYIDPSDSRLVDLRNKPDTGEGG